MNDSGLDTPILFLIFNRPDTTQIVFDQIRRVKPKYLYVAADGPRLNNSSDLQKCSDTRKIINQVDWDCDLKVLYRNKNLGCGLAVSTAITWFFDNVDAGIILEDDCVPNKSFFYFCEQMLVKYAYDNRIWHVAGYNNQNGLKRGESDYYFSQETPIWGWATWKRVWFNYNLKLELLPTLEKNTNRKSIKYSFLQSATCLYDFRKVYNGRINTWDYQYSFYQLINSGLSIIPNYNLVANIGFNIDSTHTKKANKKIIRNKTIEFNFKNIKHPNFVIVDYIADRYTYNNRTSFLKKIFVYFWYIAKSFNLIK